MRDTQVDSMGCSTGAHGAPPPRASGLQLSRNNLGELVGPWTRA